MDYESEVDLSTTLVSPHDDRRTLSFEYPIINAAGIFCYPPILERMARGRNGDIGRLGGVVTKSIGIEPRKGFKPPIVAYLEDGSLVNAVGLSNPGYEEFLAEMIEGGYYPLVVNGNHVPFIVSFFAHKPDESPVIVEALNPYCDAFEFNAGCPNLLESECTGMLIGSEPELAYRYVNSTRKATEKPLIVKLTPNVPDIIPVAEAVVEAGADILAVINTEYPGEPVDYRGRPILTNRRGGISGPRIKPRGLEIVRELYNWRSDVPLIGMGGAETAEDVFEYLKSGASLVALGTAFQGMTTEEVWDYLATLYRNLDRLISEQTVEKPARNLSEVVGIG